MVANNALLKAREGKAPSITYFLQPLDTLTCCHKPTKILCRTKYPGITSVSSIIAMNKCKHLID